MQSKMNISNNKYCQLNRYDIGKKFNYWKDHSDMSYVINCEELYIPRTHSTLKDEMLQNGICRISKIQWQYTMVKAVMHLQTDCASQVRCEYPLYVGNDNGSMLKLHHVSAIMIYCNYDTLSRKFNRERD